QPLAYPSRPERADPDATGGGLAQRRFSGGDRLLSAAGVLASPAGLDDIRRVRKVSLLSVRGSPRGSARRERSLDAEVALRVSIGFPPRHAPAVKARRSTGRGRRRVRHGRRGG